MDIERQTTGALEAVVLDPHPIWLDAIEMVLGRIGATIVLKTSSSSEAVAAIERSQPRLLTLELDTPPRRAGRLRGHAPGEYARAVASGDRAFEAP